MQAFLLMDFIYLRGGKKMTFEYYNIKKLKELRNLNDTDLVDIVNQGVDHYGYELIRFNRVTKDELDSWKVTPETISSWEKGSKMPLAIHIDVLSDISMAYGHTLQFYSVQYRSAKQHFADYIRRHILGQDLTKGASNIE